MVYGQYLWVLFCQVYGNPIHILFGNLGYFWVHSPHLPRYTPQRAEVMDALFHRSSKLLFFLLLIIESDIFTLTKFSFISSLHCMMKLECCWILRYSGIAKIVARALTTLGFKNCWIVADGFSGGRGWLQSRLGTDSYSVALAEVLAPSRVIPAAVGRLGTPTFQSSRKLLPGSADDWRFCFS